jgi:hypothetical protein
MGAVHRDDRQLLAIPVETSNDHGAAYFFSGKSL